MSTRAIFMLDRSLAALFKSRSGLPRVRTAHNRELIHRSAGEELRSRSVSVSAAALLRPPPSPRYEVRPRRDKRGVDLISDAIT
jgi:hypothetical protein